MGLSEEQLQMQTIAKSFAEKEFLPNMKVWDREVLLTHWLVILSEARNALFRSMSR